METALYDVPAPERIPTTLAAALWARPGHICEPEALIVWEITSIVRGPLRQLTAAARRRSA